MMRGLPPLPTRARAELFLHLSVMERSGLPPAQAYALLKLPKNLQGRLSTMQRLLRKGLDIPSAGYQSGLFSDLETGILRAACSAGSPAMSYRRLAQRYDQKARHASQIRSRMAMPLLILLIALMVQPLPALVTGSISGVAYLGFVLRPFGMMLVLWGLYRFVVQRLTVINTVPTPVQSTLTRWLLGTPGLGKMLTRYNVRDFYENLALMLDAGLPILDAVPRAVQTVQLCTIREDFSSLTGALQRGLTLTQAVGMLKFQSRYGVQSFVQTGEGSGALPEMLLRFADGESEAVARTQAALAEWLPRLVYGLIAAWMAWQILHSHIG